MQEFWTKDANGEDVLTIPSEEITMPSFARLMGELRRTNHPTYVTIYDGVANLLCYQGETTIAGWDRAICQFIELGALNGVLVDRGKGFWAEHRALWQDPGNGWFRIKKEYSGCAQLVDRYILRQKILLRLQTGQCPAKSIASMALLQHKAMKFSNVPWPAVGI